MGYRTQPDQDHPETSTRTSTRRGMQTFLSLLWISNNGWLTYDDECCIVQMMVARPYPSSDHDCDEDGPTTAMRMDSRDTTQASSKAYDVVMYVVSCDCGVMRGI